MSELEQPGSRSRVLIVDDDATVRLALELLLRSEGLSYVSCSSPQGALEAMRAESCSLAVVDLNYVEDTTSGREGLALISALHELDEELPIVAMTGWGTIGIAVEAMQRGASDFVEKPWGDNNRLVNIIRAQLALAASRQREKKLSAENAILRERSGAGDLIGASEAMSELLSVARRVAASVIPILITGENGVGKGVLAHYIHRHSPFAEGPFISVNMGALSESTFESEMFGHTRGAYTDAKTERIGRVELADRGTLFMDEIANLPLPQQAKILRLLEERQYEKLGSSQTKHANIRFISATNAELDALIAQRGFRQDLLYRLNGITLRVPSLRERRSDIALLAEAFLRRAREHGTSPARRFSRQALRALESYAWPGNVRELQHVVERSVLLAQGDEILEGDLQLAPRPSPSRSADDGLAGMTLEQAEGHLVRQALARHGGNAVEAAKALGISRSALYRRLGKQEPT